jgi:site-specific DNA-methyltransferase (adenine-specific)
LLPEYEGCIRLIYADPPFYTNRRYPARIGRGEDSRSPKDWKMAEGYPDHWPDLESYLDMLYPRLQMMHRLLAPDGTLYLHLDWHANSYARVLLDEIFGQDRLLNEIIWVYHGPSPIRRAFNRKHDTILVYTKSDEYVFNVDDVRQPYNPSTVKTFASSSKAGFGKVPDLKRGKVPEDWWYFPVVARLHKERTGYPTQKPEALLERIILASSNAGDLVADFFCGSGTTVSVASRLGRNYIASDVAWWAVHTTRSRLVTQKVNPFTLQHVISKSENNAIANHSYEMMDASKVTLDIRQIPTGSEEKSGNVQGSIDLPASLTELDYWEVDPDWDGNIFRSVAQAVRPNRKGDIPGHLRLDGQTVINHLCARFVNIDGKRSQTISKRDSS